MLKVHGLTPEGIAETIVKRLKETNNNEQH